ncbi:MAG: ATP phosphoribosyltransferase regulatory subunit [Nanoarchaeota archaeon]|nr:ATP phosphoribosyltransferase regulatory subunit [Nanoarchaeota archaeon]
MKTEPVKGFKDFVGKEADQFSLIKELAKQIFERYNFQEIQTPIVEYEEFVRGDKEQKNDEAISEIFKLQDKGKRNLALRYEFTFQLKRIAKNQKLPFKRFQIGPVFRDEPVQGNRLRQFTQCDIDTIGSTPKDEAEILAAITDILTALKIPSKIYINNRKLLNEVLEENGIKEKEQVIREIDKLDKLPIAEVKKNLKQYKAEKIIEIFAKPPTYFKKYKSFSEIEELAKYCSYYGIKVNFQPSLARGLAYYNGNVFEIKSNIKETICGGGSYSIDGTPSTGISFSIERLMAVSKIIPELERILIVSLDQDKKTIDLSKNLRKQGKNVSVFFGKPNKAMEYANSYGIKKVIFVGKKEVQEKKFLIKDLQTGKQKILTIKKSQ